MLLFKITALTELLLSLVLVVFFCDVTHGAINKFRASKVYRFHESAGDTVGKEVFRLEKENPNDQFETSYNEWVTVDSVGTVRVKNIWRLQQLEPGIGFFLMLKIRDDSTNVVDKQQVFISVLQVDDTQVQFTNRPLTMQTVIALDASPGTPVYTLNAESSNRDSDIRYIIVRDRTGGDFGLDERTGVISTKNAKSYHYYMEYVLFVRAEDRNSPVNGTGGYASTGLERVSIVGGERPPQFYSPIYEDYIPEDTAVGSPIVKVEAKSFSTAEILYSLELNDEKTFTIDSKSGIVKLAKPLDFENMRAPHTFQLLARATADSEREMNATVEVRIIILDVNDNEPEFLILSAYRTVIEEDIPLQSAIIDVKAVDSDSGNNSEIIYSVDHDSFSIDNNGTISVNERLDADENGGLYTFSVIATDRGNPPKQGRANVIVYTLNTNDEKPKFTQAVYTPNIDEDSVPNSFVTTVIAGDIDGDNVEYGFEGGALEYEQFVIDKQTGLIRLYNGPISLDKDKYQLNVTAVDDGSCCSISRNSVNTASAVVVVFVTDVNDNKPVFKDCSSYRGEIERGAPIGTPVVEVTATDRDKGVNGQVRYSILRIPGQKEAMFSVDALSGEVTAATIFNGSEDFISVVVRASDNGDARLENFCSFDVKIRDVNDEQVIVSDTTLPTESSGREKQPPLFEKMLCEVTILEEEKLKSPKKILQTSAKAENESQDILYFISGQGVNEENPAESIFEVNSSTGAIYVRKPLDREERSTWMFTVLAQENSGVIGFAEVKVHVKDINDNAPIFPQIVYFADIPENQTRNLFVMKMTAEDADDPKEGTNANLTYSITRNVIDGSSGLPMFTIEPHTGVIKTSVCCLDREKTPDYALQIVAEDGGGLRGTGTASIRLEDINDMSPKFIKDEWITEVEETGENIAEEPILTVSVRDGDEDANIFHYKIDESSGFGANKFTILRNPDGSGSLRIVKPLDYEDPMQKNGFRFKIMVNDKGEDNELDRDHVAYSWVTVELVDINDNQPEFERNDVEATVLEDVEVGESVARFIATDSDSARHTKISYMIDETSDPLNQFAIDKFGAVTIQRNLDIESNAVHRILILANDGGEPARTGTATLNIIVEDVNDNPPQFLKEYRPVLYENTHPVKIVEIFATDADTKGNGAPFSFKMDPNASDEIRASFRVYEYPDGDNGNGIATVRSLRTFDRESQKEYHLPIIISDSGVPQMSATSTLTVIIGDENDNKMQSSSKEILVYNNFKNVNVDIPIGRAYVYDRDDWDHMDKSFSWASSLNPNFTVDKDYGMIIMKSGTPDSKYFFTIEVADQLLSQVGIKSNITITVKSLPQNAMINSGSVRFDNINDEDFIRDFDPITRVTTKSKLEKFREIVAKIIDVPTEIIDVFSVQLHQERPPITDVRFSINNQLNYDVVKINGLIQQQKEKLEQELGIKILMVGINECLDEDNNCNGSCKNVFTLSSDSYLVDANKTSLVGVKTLTKPTCTGNDRNYTLAETCNPNPCLNGGRCVTGRSNVRCECSDGYDGPRCQITYRSFNDNGFAWFPPLSFCDSSHISIEFLTKSSDGILFYNGPISTAIEEHSDLIALEIQNGKPRLLIDFGSGALELILNTSKILNDDNWHRLDVFWDTKTARLDLDRCVVHETVEDSGDIEMDMSLCQAVGEVPGSSEYLNLNTPLQLGGLSHRLPFSNRSASVVPQGVPFVGCVKNLMINSELFDLGKPALSNNTKKGCPRMEKACGDTSLIASCGINGICTGSPSYPVCKCKAGWTGPSCDEPTIPSFFGSQSYVRYALVDKPRRYNNEFQLSFRTWQENGELFRASDQHNSEYAVLEIKNGHLRFRYDTNIHRAVERDLWLSAITVNDGIWHTVVVERFGSTAYIMLDGGEGRRYNETTVFSGDVLSDIDNLEGVVIGGNVQYTGVMEFTVHNDFNQGCMQDFRLDGKQLPMPPEIQGSEAGMTTMFKNLETNCPSSNTCPDVTCLHPFICIDLWMRHECGCSEGSVFENYDCVNVNECEESQPCLNGGKCFDREPEEGRYICLCKTGYMGKNCDIFKPSNVTLQDRVEGIN